MKVAVIAIFSMCILMAACAPNKSDIQKLKEDAKRKKACMSDCTKAKLEPICAGKTGETPKSFGNVCVLNNHNCENKDTLQKISNGQCPGAQGIRLS